jgi:hypothetical protein
MKNETTMTSFSSVVTTATREVAGFYYTSSGIVDGVAAGGGDHLALAVGNGVVANGVRKNLAEGTEVLVVAKVGGQYLGAVAVAEGTVSDKSVTEIWPSYNKPNAVVFNVTYLTKIGVIPAEMMVNQRQNLPLQDVAKVITYLLRNA